MSSSNCKPTRKQVYDLSPWYDYMGFRRTQQTAALSTALRKAMSDSEMSWSHKPTQYS